jgi:hypothetical protein
MPKRKPMRRDAPRADFWVRFKASVLLLFAFLGNANTAIDVTTKTIDLAHRITSQEIRDSSPVGTVRGIPIAAGNDPGTAKARKEYKQLYGPSQVVSLTGFAKANAFIESGRYKEAEQTLGLVTRKGATEYRPLGQFYLSSVIAREAVESSNPDLLVEAQKGYEGLLKTHGATEILGRQGLDLVEQSKAGKNVAPKLDELMRQIAKTFDVPSDPEA